MFFHTVSNCFTLPTPVPSPHSTLNNRTNYNNTCMCFTICTKNMHIIVTFELCIVYTVYIWCLPVELNNVVGVDSTMVMALVMVLLLLMVIIITWVSDAVWSFCAVDKQLNCERKPKLEHIYNLVFFVYKLQVKWQNSKCVCNVRKTQHKIGQHLIASILVSSFSAFHILHYNLYSEVFHKKTKNTSNNNNNLLKYTRTSTPTHTEWVEQAFVCLKVFQLFDVNSIETISALHLEGSEQASKREWEGERVSEKNDTHTKKHTASRMNFK